MEADLIVFLVLALVAIGSALGMLLNKNAIYSALFLILNFASVAVFYVILGAPFIAVTQVTVYAGAIMVLFLFVIMLLGAEELAGTDKFDWQKPVAVILAIILIAETAYVIFIREELEDVVRQVGSDYGSPKEIAKVLFKDYLLPFEITAVLLLAAMVGAVAITKRERKKKANREPEK
jgi:NADH-quinone oxidoreductase subunit J